MIGLEQAGDWTATAAKRPRDLGPARWGAEHNPVLALRRSMVICIYG